VLGAAVLVGLSIGAVACTDDDATAPTTSPSTSAGRLTNISGPIPPPSVTVPIVTLPTPSSAPGPATTAPGATTVAPGAPAAPPGGTPTCDAPTLFAVLQASAPSLPPGIGPATPACAGGWATMVVGATGQESALSVFQVVETTWRLAGLGTAAVCSTAVVPPELFGPLGCNDWE
jgi:hypothetical protein